MRLIKNDLVVVTAGKDKGKTGKIKKILYKNNKVIVDKVNMMTKHIKKREGRPGQKITLEFPIDVSNVSVLCPKLKKPTRISYVVSKTGEKQRIATVSGEVLVNNSSKK